MSRPEPFLAERLWAYPPALEETVDVIGGVERDDAGRVTVVRYVDGKSESYRYDERGRLVEIDEHPQLWDTAPGAAARVECGGTLRVEHDDRGPLRITDAQGTVWARSDRPWPERLAAGARSIAGRCVDALAEAGLSPDMEVYSLALVYVGDGGMEALISVGLEAERQRVLAGGDDAHEIACTIWYPEPPSLDRIEIDPDGEDGTPLLAEAALNDPRVPHRTVLTEAAKLLARRDWSDVFAVTDDFVVYVAEHDEGFSDKHASVREVNPPERVAAWDAAWPPHVARDDDDRW